MGLFGAIFGDDSAAHDRGVERATSGCSSALSVFDHVTLYESEKAAQRDGYDHARNAMVEAEILADRLGRR